MAAKQSKRAADDPSDSSPSKQIKAEPMELRKDHKQSLARLAALLKLDPHSRSTPKATQGDLKAMVEILGRHSTATPSSSVDNSIKRLVAAMQKSDVLVQCGFHLEFLVHQPSNSRNLQKFSRYCTVLNKGQCKAVSELDTNMITTAQNWATNAHEAHLALHSIVASVMQTEGVLVPPKVPGTAKSALEQAQVELVASGSLPDEHDRSWRYASACSCVATFPCLKADGRLPRVLSQHIQRDSEESKSSC
jgi:hypothetical protein